MYSTKKTLATKPAADLNDTLPLFPLTKASPYERRNFPSTYSSVFSREMFM